MLRNRLSPFVLVGAFVGVGAPCAAQSLDATELRESFLGAQPDDPFVDLLRNRIEHRRFYSYPTVTDGQHHVEATTITNYGIEDILDLYVSEFERHDLRYRVQHVPGSPTAMFHGTIDGEAKKVTLLSVPGGSTLVRLASERSDFRHQRNHESLLDAHPELRRLGDSIAMDRQHKQGIATAGMLFYESNDPPAVAIDRARSELRIGGWREHVSHGDDGTPIVHFRKGDASATLVSSSEEGDPDASFALRVVHVPSR